MKRILITGGSGMVGKHLSLLAISKGYNVHWLSRKKSETKDNNIKVFQWDVQNNWIEESAFDGVEYVVHLAGAGIADKKWTNEYKAEIINSRVKSAHLLVNSIIQNNFPIKKFVGASAVGFYGMKTDEKIYTEESEKGNDFLADVCKKWEDAYLPLMKNNFNAAIVRIGLVLSVDGGVYKKLKPLFKLGLGSALGKGNQYMPWIHIYDLCEMILFLLEKEKVTGVFNGVSGEFVTNKEFTRHFAHSLKRPIFLPNIPEWFLKMILGEQAQMLTTGLKISSDKIKQNGFQFKYQHLDDAFRDLNMKS